MSYHHDDDGCFWSDNKCTGMESAICRRAISHRNYDGCQFKLQEYSKETNGKNTKEIWYEI